MKVRRIHLHRFRGFEDLQLQFPKETNIAVFIGENGSGKTSLLEGISMILRDSLYKNHRYDKVDWDNPLNVNNNHKAGRISIDIEAGRRTCNFSQALLANRARLITEESLVLKKGEELTDEEKMEYYKEQAKAAMELEHYNKALENALLLFSIQERVYGKESWELNTTYKFIANAYRRLNDYEQAAAYYNKRLQIQDVHKAIVNNKELALSYRDLGQNYFFIEGKEKEGLSFLFKAVSLYESDEIVDDYELGIAYWLITSYYYILQEYDNSIKYGEKAISLELKEYRLLEYLYLYVAKSYYNLGQYEKAINAHLEELKFILKNEKLDDIALNGVYESLAINYSNLGDTEKEVYYRKKIKNNDDEQPSPKKTFIPALFRDDSNDTKDFNAYIETWIPLVLHYDAQSKELDSFKDALPIAFHIPMTTDFDLIADWFTEHENDENRKRLRIKADYRSAELETIRQVITQGLTILNGDDNVHFSDLQTELEDTVKDGQVSSWLSIKKNGQTLNVIQLSDGEKRVLVLLIDITRRLITAAKNNKIEKVLEGEGVVLIDEIEQHLHPKWQRTILPTLQKLFPNIQFIITTHSPQVLSYVPNGAAFTVENGQVYPQNTYGRNNEWILEAIMNDVPRPKEVQVKLDTYFDMIREGKIEASQELREELEQLIGADEPELLKADILIRRKQKSLLANETNP